MNRRSRSPLPPLTAALFSLLLPVAAVAAPMPAPLLRELLASEFARQGGDADAAAGHALAAARVANDPALSARALDEALQAGDAPRARVAMQRWEVLEPTSPLRDAYALRFHVAQGEADLAVAAARRMLPRQGGAAEVALGLSVDYLDGGVIARAVLRALLDAGVVPLRIDDWLAMAGVAHRLGDPALAGQWIDALVQRFPADPRAGLLRAERLSRRGEREAARAEVRLVLARADLPAEQRRIGAEALAVLGDPAGAAQALAQGPQDARTLGLRASWLARSGRLDALRALYGEAQAVAGPGVDPALVLLLGQLAERLQDWPAAEGWYRRLRQGEAGDRARLRLGIVLGRQGRGDDARAVLRALQADDDADGALRRDAFVAEADQFEAQGRRDAADEALRRGLAVLEDDPALRVARARLARNAGRDAEAEAELRAVLRRDPNHAPALRALGSLLVARRRPVEAEPLLARAWAEDPGAPTAAAWGEALWLGGRRDEARQAWARGRDLDPGDPVLADTLRRYVP